MVKKTKKEKDIKIYNFIETSRRRYVVGLIIIPMYIILLRLLIVNPILRLIWNDSDAVDDFAGPIKTTIILIALVILLRKFLMQSIKDFFYSKALDNLKWIVLSFLIIFGSKIVYVVISMILKAGFSAQLSWMLAEKSPNQVELDNFGLMYPAAFLIFTIVIAPIVEELIFRCIMYYWLRKVNVLFALAVTSLTFSGIHLINYMGNISIFQAVYYMINYLPVAIVLTVLYEKRRNILHCILLHMLVNIVSIIL